MPIPHSENIPGGYPHVPVVYPDGGQYAHSRDTNLRAVHNAMEYNEKGEPILRTSQSDRVPGLTDDGSSGGILWNIALANKNIDGAFYAEAFGQNIDLGTAVESVWDGGGLYEYITAAEPLIIPGTANDNAVGIGARTVRVTGLNALHERIEEDIVVGGGSSTQTFIRIFRAYVFTAGIERTNHAVLNILGVNSTRLLAQIGVDGTGGNSVGRGQTFMAMYTVPAGKTGYIMQWTAGSGKQNTDATTSMYIRPFGTDRAFFVQDLILTSATTFTKTYITPILVPEKSDIEIRSYSSVNNTPISSSFHLFQIDNSELPP